MNWAIIHDFPQRGRAGCVVEIYIGPSGRPAAAQLIGPRIRSRSSVERIEADALAIVSDTSQSSPAIHRYSDLA
jgi:hypothetical protein